MGVEEVDVLEDHLGDLVHVGKAAVGQGDRNAEHGKVKKTVVQA